MSTSSGSTSAAATPRYGSTSNTASVGRAYSPARVGGTAAPAGAASASASTSGAASSSLHDSRGASTSAVNVYRSQHGSPNLDTTPQASSNSDNAGSGGFLNPHSSRGGEDWQRAGPPLTPSDIHPSYADPDRVTPSGSTFARQQQYFSGQHQQQYGSTAAPMMSASNSAASSVSAASSSAAPSFASFAVGGNAYGSNGPFSSAPSVTSSTTSRDNSPPPQYSSVVNVPSSAPVSAHDFSSSSASSFRPGKGANPLFSGGGAGAKDTPLMRRLRTFSSSPTAWLIYYFAFNLGLTLYNKLVLQGFPFPWTLTGIQMLSGSIGTQIAMRQGYFTPANLTTRENVIMLAFSFLYTVNIAVSNLSLHLVTVPFHQVVRAMTPLFTIVLAAMFMHKRHSRETYMSLGPVVLGVVFATYGDYYFTAWGFVLTLLGTLLAAIKTLVTNRVQVGRLKLHPLDLLVRMSPLAFIQCVCFAWSSGELERVRAYGATEMTREKATALAVNGLIAFGLNVVSFTANKKTSALTMTVAGASPLSPSRVSRAALADTMSSQRQAGLDDHPRRGHLQHLCEPDQPVWDLVDLVRRRLVRPRRAQREARQVARERLVEWLAIGQLDFRCEPLWE